MRLTALLPASVLLAPFLVYSQTGSSTAQKPGQAACDDDYLATLGIPIVSSIDASAKMVTFTGGGWGYQTDVATPSAYINWRRDTAAKYLTEYSGPSDKDKLAVFRVWVDPPAQAFPDDPRDRSVYNVILRSDDHSMTVHPLCSAQLPTVRYGNSGITANGMYGVFAMKDFEDLLKKSSVSVTFVLTGGKAYDCKLDKKKLAALGLSGDE